MSTMERVAKNKILVHIDGGSRGNPGPSAIGVVIEYDGQQKTYGEQIGVGTNNQAEYKSIIFVLKKIPQLVGKAKAKESYIEIHSDSQLLVEQVSGFYKIKEPEIQKLFLEFWNLRTEFKSVLVVYVPRDKNKLADKLVNQALDTLI